jgi:hypothetical protein
MSTAIPRVPGLDPASFHRHYTRRNRPVVIPGLAGDWPAVRSWSLPALADQVGDTPVPLQVSEAGQARQETLPFDHSVRAMLDPGRAATQHYVQQVSLAALPESLRSALGSLEPYLGPRYPARLHRFCRDEPRLWVGPAGTVTPVHFDLAHNLFVQLVGRKRFTLFDPSQSAALRYPDYAQQRLTSSGVDVEQPDLERYPDFARARRVVIDLAPGDVLFLPHSWWHHVRALEPSVSLSHWWVSPGMFVAQRGYWFHRLRREALRARAS